MKELLETGVKISLVYDGSVDALVGKIKDFAVAVRENNKTMSYGCLIWAKKGDFTAITDAEEYLASQVTAKPDVVKHFKVTDRGIAVALVKTADPYMNITNIKRFLMDLASSLSVNFYKSCCYDCGATEGLGIYDAGGTLVQACSKCGVKYKPVMIFDEAAGAADHAPFPIPTPVPAPEPVPAQVVEPVPEPVPVAEQIPEPVRAEAVAEAAKPEERSEVISETIHTEAAESKPAESAAEAVAVGVAAAVEAVAEAVKEEQPAPARQTPTDDALSGFSEFVAKTEEAPEKKSDMPFFARKPNPDGVSDEDEFAALLSDMKPDGEHAVTNEDIEQRRIEAENEAAKSADFASFMYEEKTAQEQEDPWKNERREVKHKPEHTDFSGLMLSDGEDKAGAGELVVPEQEREVVGHDEKVAVTEYVDDSNEGEDIDVEAIESRINAPTDTSGKKLTAKETPLEADGSVPLINPTSEYADHKPSPVNGPDAVEPLESRERIHAVTDEEELRVAPAGYAGEDPRAETKDRPRFRPDRDAASLPPVPPSYMAQRVDRIRFGSNPVFGVIGALVLGILAVAFWVIINTAVESSGLGSGFAGRRVRSLVLSIATISISAGVFGGYAIGGEEVDTKGIIISAVINLLLDVVAVFAKYVFSVKAFMEKVFGYHISLVDAVDWVSYQFRAGSSSMLIDFWLNVIVMVVLLVLFIRYFMKRA